MLPAGGDGRDAREPERIRQSADPPPAFTIKSVHDLENELAQKIASVTSGFAESLGLKVI